MSRTIYSSTATYPLAVGWKCTQCGRINAKTCNIKWQSSASKQGMFYSHETADRATSQAQSQLSKMVLKIVSDAENRKFSPALNSCVCRGCSHREPWAIVKSNGRVVFGSFVASAALGINALFCILIRDWSALCWSLGIIAVLVGIAFLSMRKSANNEKKMAPVFANLKDIERPILALNAVALRQKMYGIIAQGPSDIDVINSVTASELSQASEILRATEAGAAAEWERQEWERKAMASLRIIPANVSLYQDSAASTGNAAIRGLRFDLQIQNTLHETVTGFACKLIIQHSKRSQAYPLTIETRIPSGDTVTISDYLLKLGSVDFNVAQTLLNGTNPSAPSITVSATQIRTEK